MKRKKRGTKFFLGLILVFMLTALTVSAVASERTEEDEGKATGEEVKLYIDGVKHALPDGYGVVFIQEGRTFVPVRYISETTGSNVDFCSDTHSIKITGNDREIIMEPGKKDYSINNSTKTMDAVPFIKETENRAYVPFRFAAEGLGLEIEFASIEDENVVMALTKSFTQKEKDHMLTKVTSCIKGEKPEEVPDGKTSQKAYQVVEEEELPEYIKEIVNPLKIDRGYCVFNHLPGEENKTYMMISLGEKKTGGYELSIEATIEHDDELTVIVEEQKPGEGEHVIQVLTYPYKVIELEDSYKEYNVKTTCEEELENLVEVQIEDPEFEYDDSLERIPETDPRAGESFVEGEILDIDFETRTITIEQHKSCQQSPEIDPEIKVAKEALIRRYVDDKEKDMEFSDLDEEMIVSFILKDDGEARALIKHG